MIGDNGRRQTQDDGPTLMWTGARRTVKIMLATAAACGFISMACAAPEQGPRRPAAKPKDARAAPTHPAQVRPAQVHGRPKFRPARGAAAADAKRLGALVGKECTGRADMQRNEHQWVVLCSTGKTFVVEPAAAHQAATPPLECSLAGTGPEPACFP
jgi:hypothetical protein